MTDGRVRIPSMNLRELGGYETVDGGRVARGVLWRGGHMADLDAEELATLTAVGLATVVDLRRPSEIELRPTPPIDGASTVHVSVSDEDNEFAVVINRLHDPEVAATAGDRGRAYYRDIVANRLDRYRPVFATLLDPGRWPALFHCTAGKDRTGFVAATLLHLAGVPAETVMADYLLTNEVRGQDLAGRLEIIRAERAVARGLQPEAVSDAEMDAIRTLMFVEASYLEAVEDEVASRYGSWETMARDGLGVDAATLGAFREAVLV